MPRTDLRAACVCVAAAAATLLAAWSLAAPTHSGYQSRGPEDEAHRAFRLDGAAAAALSLTALVSAVASSAGIGGGAILVPLFNLLLGFSIQMATTLSQAAILGGSVGAVGFSLTRRHPTDRRKRLIDFALAKVLMPSLLLGVSLGRAPLGWSHATAAAGLTPPPTPPLCRAGVLLNIILPAWALVASLSLLIVYLTAKTLAAGMALHRAEEEGRAEMAQGLLATQQREQAALGDRGLAAGSLDLLRGYSDEESEGGGGGEAGQVPGAEHPSWSKPGGGEAGGSAPDGAGPLTVALHSLGDPGEVGGGWETTGGRLHCGHQLGLSDAVLRPQARGGGGVPWGDIAQLLGVWAAFAGLQLGKDAFPRGAWQYGALFASQALLAAAAAALAIGRAGSKSEGPESLGAPLLYASGRAAEGDVVGGWTPRRLAAVSAITVAGGVLAGALGIGGGMVLGPMLLHLGVLPQVASATASFFVLVSSGSSVAALAAAGRLNLEYGAVLAATCLLSAVAGVALVGKLVKRSGKASLVVFLLAGLLAAGGVCTAIGALPSPE